jgi:hypothetical protein
VVCGRFGRPHTKHADQIGRELGGDTGLEESVNDPLTIDSGAEGL